MSYDEPVYTKKCPECGGYGKKVQVITRGGRVTSKTRKCLVCDGRGKV